MTSNSDNSKFFVSFSSLLNQCRITNLLRACGFSKRSGCDPLSMLIALIESKFLYKNLYLFLQSKRGQAVMKRPKSSCLKKNLLHIFHCVTVFENNMSKKYRTYFERY